MVKVAALIQGQRQAPKHATKTPPAKVAKHAAKITPAGRVSEATATKVEKVKAGRATAKTERAQYKAKVQKNVRGEQARIEAANTLIRKPRIRMLATEYIIGVALAIIALFYAQGSYHEKMGKFFVQITGLSALFFVLALTSGSAKASRSAIMFGALIDVVILLNLIRKTTSKTGATVDASVDTGDDNG